VPAPAVIPAPKAYINAVAVKGFVVELRVAQDWRVVLRGPAACNSRTFETSSTGAISLRTPRATHAGGRP
jgi:hypothetical protein